MVRPCPVCGASADARRRRLGTHDYRRCRACRALFVDPVPPPAEVLALYEAGYARARGHHDEAVATAKRRTYARYLRRLGPPRGTLLEVGCSTGEGLAVARGLGWDVRGVEPDPEAARLAGERLGRGVVAQGTFEALDMPPSSCGAVVMIDVVEHFAEPRAALVRARELLASGGRLVLVTPDLDSISARLMGGAWPHYLPDHLTLLGRRGLLGLVRSVGLEVESHGGALKVLSTAMLGRHYAANPHLVGARLVAALARRLPAVGLLVPMGEVHVVARRP